MLFALSLMPLTSAAEQLPPPGSEPVTEAQAVQKSVRITGTVVDAKGAPVVGATVIETGTQQGTVTGSDGKFVMNVQPSNKIQVSYVGYVTQTLAIGATTSFNVVLKEDAAMLDDVVVVGYGAVRKADLTGSVSSISADALVRGGKTDAVGAMQGALPGVQIQRSNNKPGGTYNILIRGLNTISGSTAPLVVVDGVPGAALENINPDDIERIDILKDASSTAIYGSRATNGVVLVTTKRGKQGDVNITYNGYVGFRKYTNMPDMMSGDEYAQIARETARAKNNNVYKDDSQVFTASELKAIQDGNYFDWLDAVAGTAVMTNHTVSASGGNDVTTYAMSAGYYFEDGMVKPQEFSRYNLRAAIDVKPVDYLKFGINMYGTHSVRDTGNSDVTQDAIRMRPTYHPTNLVTGAEEWAYSNGQYNPLVAQKHEWNKNKIYNLLGNVYLEIMPLKNLSVKTTFSPDITFNEKGQYRGKYTKANKGANEPTSNYAKDSYMNWTWDNQISYKFEKGDHRFDVTGVFSMLQYQYERLYGLGNGLAYNSLWYNLQGGSVKNQAQSSYRKNSMISYLGRVNYVFRDKYFVTASYRMDGSSKLAEGNKWGGFASAAVAWRISGEEFMKDIDWIDNLKLRFSYGQTGNDNVSPYQTEGSISGAKYYQLGSTAGLGYVPNNLRNLELGWERTTEYNVGLDFGVLGNRISGSVEYYNRLTEDLIMNKTVPATTGYSSVKANVGSVRNQGFELMLNTVNIQTKNFSWTTNFNVAYNKNEIVKLAYKEDLSSRGPSMQGLEGDYSNLWIIGKPIDVNYQSITLGVWQLDEAAEAAKYGCKPGNYKVLDLDGDGKITDADHVFTGKRTPDWTGGMTNTFTYREFDLSFAMSYQAGADRKNQYYVSFALEGNTNNFNNLRGSYWTPENPTNERHQPGNHGPLANHRGSWGEEKSTNTHRFSSTDFLLVNHITLGYTFKKELLKKLHLDNLRVYATVQNPFIWAEKNAFDPQQMTTGIGSTDFMTCNVMFGVNVGF